MTFSWLPDSTVGPLAGFATSALWVMTAIFFTGAALRIGSTAVNTLRLLAAVVFLGITHRLLSGVWFPEVSSQQMWLLAVSGVVGLTVADQALFTSFVLIGPRRALLVMTTSPLFALCFGAAFLDERIGWLGIVGITVTMLGVAWVILDREKDGKKPAAANKRLLRGLALAALGAFAQATGAMFSKLGMGHGLGDDVSRLTPQAATFVRMIFGFAGVVPLFVLRWRQTMRRSPKCSGAESSTGAGSDRSLGILLTLAGAVVGPFLGVWMSLVAFDRCPIGIAQTLCSLSPVLILPLVPLLYEDRLTARAVVGALIAVSGTALLFL